MASFLNPRRRARNAGPVGAYPDVSVPRLAGLNRFAETLGDIGADVDRQVFERVKDEAMPEFSAELVRLENAAGEDWQAFEAQEDDAVASVLANYSGPFKGKLEAELRTRFRNRATKVAEQAERLKDERAAQAAANRAEDLLNEARFARRRGDDEGFRQLFTSLEENLQARVEQGWLTPEEAEEGIERAQAAAEADGLAMQADSVFAGGGMSGVLDFAERIRRNGDQYGFTVQEAERAARTVEARGRDLETERRRRQAAARRQKEERLADVRTRVERALGVFGGGKLPADYDDLLADAAGTPYEDDLVAAHRAHRSREAYRLMDPAERDRYVESLDRIAESDNPQAQADALRDLEAIDPLRAADLKAREDKAAAAREAVEDVADEAKADVRAARAGKSLERYEEKGGEVPPVALDDPQSWADRATTAAAAASEVGGAPQLLRPFEREALGEALQGEGRGAIVANMIEGLGRERAREVLGEVAGDGAESAAVLGAMVLEGRPPRVIQDIEQGRLLIQEGRASAPTVTQEREVWADLQPRIGEGVRGIGGVRELAGAAYARKARSRGLEEFDASLYRETVLEVLGMKEATVGRRFMRRSGKRTLLPTSVDAETVDEALGAMAGDDWRRASAFDQAPEQRGHQLQAARLEWIGGTRYRLVTSPVGEPPMYATTAEGEMYVLDLEKLP